MLRSLLQSLPSPRVLNLVAVAICATLLAAAYYMQFGLGLEPCSLCILQRIALIALALVFLGAGVHAPSGRVRFVWAGLVALTAGAGIAIAGRHVWLQSLPADLVPACGPGLNYLIDVLPLFDALAEAFHGSGECAKVDWTFLGLALPAWTLLSFIALGVGGFVNNLRNESHDELRRA